MSDTKRPLEEPARPEQEVPRTDPQEARLIELFCQGPALQRCLASFCKDAQSARDPVLHVLLIALNAPVQIQLTGVGLQPFQGEELTFPYYRMDQPQRDFLLELIECHPRWSMHESSMVWRRKGARATLPPLDVLEAVCVRILSAEKAYAEPRARVAVCNILLQRVQASVPLSPALQADLNARLFPDTARDPSPAIKA